MKGFRSEMDKNIYVVIAQVIWIIDPAKLNELRAWVCIPCSFAFFCFLFFLVRIRKGIHHTIHEHWMHASGPFIEMKQNKQNRARTNSERKQKTQHNKFRLEQTNIWVPRWLSLHLHMNVWWTNCVRLFRLRFGGNYIVVCIVVCIVVYSNTRTIGQQFNLIGSMKQWRNNTMKRHFASYICFSNKWIKCPKPLQQLASATIVWLKIQLVVYRATCIAFKQFSSIKLFYQDNFFDGQFFSWMCACSCLSLLTTRQNMR